MTSGRFDQSAIWSRTKMWRRNDSSVVCELAISSGRVAVVMVGPRRGRYGIAHRGRFRCATQIETGTFGASRICACEVQFYRSGPATKEELMKFSQVLKKVIKLAEVIHAYWERELPKR